MSGYPSEFDMILDRCLEAVRRQQWTVEECLANYPEYRHELEPLLRTAAALRSSRTIVRPSGAFRRRAARRIEARLRASRRRPAQRPRFRPVWGGQRVWQPALAILLVTVLALSTAGLARAADTSLPGEALYGLDLAMEQAQVRLAAQPDQAVSLRLHFALERLDEAALLAMRGDSASTRTALEGYIALVTAAEQASAGEQSLSMVVSTAVGSYQEQLAALLYSAPQDAAPLIEEALDTGPRGGKACDGTADQPALTAVAAHYGASYDEVLARFCAGYGIGEISRAYRLSQESGVPVEDIFAMLDAGISWGAIQQELDSGGADGQPENPPGQSGDTPGQSGEEPGQSGSAPGQDNTPGQQQTPPGQQQTPGPPQIPPGQQHTPGPPQIPPGKDK
jgi:hypothetical protein